MDRRLKQSDHQAPVDENPQPPVTKVAKQDARAQREAEALRENLKRRKEQARARQANLADTRKKG